MIVFNAGALVCVYHRHEINCITTRKGRNAYLGRPHDADFQHRVLASAFGLLPRTDVPVLEDFPETIVDEPDAAVPLDGVVDVLEDLAGRVRSVNGRRPVASRTSSPCNEALEVTAQSELTVQRR